MHWDAGVIVLCLNRSSWWSEILDGFIIWCWLPHNEAVIMSAVDIHHCGSYIVHWLIITKVFTKHCTSSFSRCEDIPLDRWDVSPLECLWWKGCDLHGQQLWPSGDHDCMESACHPGIILFMFKALESSQIRQTWKCFRQQWWVLVKSRARQRQTVWLMSSWSEKVCLWFLQSSHVSLLYEPV